jgi:hypothetical protein
MNEEHLTPQQQREVQELDELWGVEDWVLHTDRAATVTLITGDVVIVQPDGETEVL